MNLTVKLTAAGKTFLHRRHKLKATLAVIATGSAGKTQTVKTTVMLRL